MNHNQIRIQNDLETATTLSTGINQPDSEVRPLPADQGKDSDPVGLSCPDDPLTPLNLPAKKKMVLREYAGGYDLRSNPSKRGFECGRRRDCSGVWSGA